MDKLAVEHLNDSNYCFPLDEHHLKIRLRTKKGDDIKSVTCLWNVLQHMYLTQIKAPMEIAYVDEYYAYYECVLYSKDPRFSYVFYIKTNDGTALYFSELGFTKEYDFSWFYLTSFRLPYINPIDVVFDNKMFSGDVFYQIFPERFNIGDFSKDKNYINRPWDTSNLKGSNGNRVQDSFIGGDLKGIELKLDYLKDLGVNTIYLTPIFKSQSNHKYDVDDYFKVDEMFGKDEDLLDLVKEIHKHGQKIVLDIVFNHSAFNNNLFQDVVKNGKKSKYYDFYIVNGDKPDFKKKNYATFGDVPNMPKLNSNSFDEHDYFVEVGKYFINKFNIDGYRLDVANEASHTFWQRFKYELRKIKPDIILIGECWNNAISYLSRNEFDSVMNYPFLYTCKDFYINHFLDAEHFSYRLNSLLMRYKDGNNRMMLNLLDSHDTERFYNLCKPNKDLCLLAFLTLISYIGWPMIYYGDEIFMEGGTDPFNRKGMEWNSKEFGSKENILFKKIVHLRNNELFKTGDIKIYNENSLFVIERYKKEEKVKIVINNSEKSVKYAVNGMVILSNNYDNGVLNNYSFIVFK